MSGCSVCLTDCACSVIHSKAKIGNFVEVKKSEIHEGAKVSHLSYVGEKRSKKIQILDAAL